MLKYRFYCFVQKDEWEEKYHTMKRNYELTEVKSKVSIDTMAKEIDVIRKSRDDEVTKLQEALTNHMEGTADSESQLDQLRMDVAEANTQIEKMTFMERELRKSLEIAISERKNEEVLKNEAISSYEMELTVRKILSTVVYCFVSIFIHIKYAGTHITKFAHYHYVIF